MPSPLVDDPRLADLLDATEKLIQPGQPFEVGESEVLGERVAVFKNRPGSLRQVLLEGTAFGAADAYVFDDGRRISFVQLERDAASIAVHLRDRYRIGPGDRVAVCAANCPEWLQTMWAVASLNAVVVAMNGWWTATEMRNALDLAEPAVLVVDEKRAARLEGEPGVPTVVVERDFAPFLAQPDAPLPESQIAEDDPYILIFTSGTTGRPKAAVLSHRTVIGYLMLQTFLGACGALMAGRLSQGGPAPTRLAPYPLCKRSGAGGAWGWYPCSVGE
jgi:acyl-CoA synthetase (AMP-forming)/AMP-acid ligase II